MTVKEVIALAAENLGRDDLAALADGGEAAEEDGDEEIGSLLRCYNLVENEVALDYFPLRKTETLAADGDFIAYADFGRRPVHVEKALVGGRLARFSAYPDGIRLTDGGDRAEITYSYAPSKKSIADDCECSAFVLARCLSYGVAGEFCLTSGETGRAATWQRRYYDALRAFGLLKKTLRVRSRRWE